MKADLKKLEIARLLPNRKIQRRVAELARKINRDYRDKNLTIVVVLKGALMFGADLIRRLTVPVVLETVSASSYQGTTRKKIHVQSISPKSTSKRDILIVDDILDTGRTLATLLKSFRRLKPRSIRTCVLLDKKIAAKKFARADYVGFSVPDCFIVGYGLDFNGRCRNLPYVGYLKNSS